MLGFRKLTAQINTVILSEAKDLCIRPRQQDT
jgi:hypothetical protein